MSFILRSDEKAGEGEETRQGDHGYIFFPITTFLKTFLNLDSEFFKIVKTHLFSNLKCQIFCQKCPLVLLAFERLSTHDGDRGSPETFPDLAAPTPASCNVCDY